MPTYPSCCQSKRATAPELMRRPSMSDCGSVGCQVGTPTGPLPGVTQIDAAPGLRAATASRLSAHDAKHAVGACAVALRSPSPPFCNTSQHGITRRSAARQVRTERSCARANTAVQCGGSTLRASCARIAQKNSKGQATCKSGTCEGSNSFSDTFLLLPSLSTGQPATSGPRP